MSLWVFKVEHFELMAATISDSELRDELLKFGFKAGPIVPSTRELYFKKLQTLKNGGSVADFPPSIPQATKSTLRKRNQPRKVEPVDADEILFNSQSVLVSRSNTSNQSSLKDQPRHSIQSTSVADSASNSGDSVQPSSLNRLYQQPSSGTTTTSAESARPTEHSSSGTRLGMQLNSPFRRDVVATPESNIHKQLPRETTPQRGAGHTPTRKTYIYYEDASAEEDETAEPSPMASAFSRVASWFTGSPSHKNSPITPRSRSNLSSSMRRYGTNKFSNDEASIQISDTDNSDAEIQHRSPFFRSLLKTSSDNRYRETGIGTSPSLLFTPPRSTGKTTVASTGRSVFSISNDADDSILNERFGNITNQQPADLEGCRLKSLLSVVTAHIPNIILIFGICMFAILVLSYLVLKDHHGEIGKMADIQKIVCPSSASPTERQNCVDQKDLTPTLSVLGVLFDILSRYAGEYHCKTGSLASTHLKVQSARALVERQVELSQTLARDIDDFNRIWRNTLVVILNLGQIHFSIVAFDNYEHQLGPNAVIDQIETLESLSPYFSGFCRLHLWLAWLCGLFVTTFWIGVVGLTITGILYLLHFLRTKRIQAAEKKATRIRELVSEVVRLLQQQLRESEIASNKPPYIPICTLREQLSKQHPDVSKLWPEIVRYIYEVETCITVQEWRGIGETWQWQGGTGWQGSALSDKSQKPSFVTPPTECLKIRNMFSVEGSDEPSKRRIKRELLKKLSSCGPILHIGLDQVGSNGLVYIKCASPDVAGRVYYSIHANYFDGRLVTVKFLRNNKYCLRFPEAHGSLQPLRLSDFE